MSTERKQSIMKSVWSVLIAAGLLSVFVMGCSYEAVAVAGDKAVVLRNNAFLFGAFRRAYVCKITDAGLTDCNRVEDP
jgi:hypothetical protein